MTDKSGYGSVEFYTEMFSDILADAQYDDPSYGNNIISGFKNAIRMWRMYHENSVREYERIEKQANDEI